MPMFDRVLITSTVPDRLNNNTSLRHYLASGLRRFRPEAEVISTPYESAVAQAHESRPDLIVAMGGVALGHVDLRSLRRVSDGLGATLVFWLHDDPFEIDYAYRATAIADVVFSNDAWAVEHYGNAPVHHLPLAGCPDTHFRQIDENRERDIDLLFCGVAYPNRVEFFRAVKDVCRGMKCIVIGDGWPQDLGFAINRRVSPIELADLTSRSLMTLNITRDHNIANKRFDVPPSTPGPRTFETALAGSTQLYVVNGLEIEKYFRPEEEITLVDNYVDFDYHVRRLRSDRQANIRIASNAQTRALREHCYEHRVTQMMRVIQRVVPLKRDAKGALHSIDRGQASRLDLPDPHVATAGMLNS